MLGDEHADADATEIEAIQEILDLAVEIGWFNAVRLLHLQHALGHRLNHVVVTVTNLDQRVTEPVWQVTVTQHELGWEQVSVTLAIGHVKLTLAIGHVKLKCYTFYI